MKRVLLAAAIATPALYYLTLALAPSWLGARIGGWPLSVLLALAAFAILLLVTLLDKGDDA